MRRVQIPVRLSTDSINHAKRVIEEEYALVLERGKELARRLSEIGIYEASYRFTTAMYDGDMSDIDVTAIEDGNGYKIIASGKAVCFIEFGAGVYHNGTEPYPNPRPQGIVGIGEYGRGQGKKQGWVYRDGTGARTFTRGNPAAMPMFYAHEEMKQAIRHIAEEVFV